MKKIVMLVALGAAMAAKADYWMTFCKMPGQLPFEVDVQ